MMGKAIDWHDLFMRYPRWRLLIVTAKRCRTKVGLLLASACIVRMLLRHERPVLLESLSVWSMSGAALIAAGVAFRIAAMGVLKKKESLSTTGVYSLCQHPLYLGSMLITFGFCLILRNPMNFATAFLYFLMFYPLTMAWETIRLGQRFGAEYDKYVQKTPLLLPRGRYHSGGFNWRDARINGADLLLGLIVVLLTAVEIMARVLRSQL